MSGNTKTAPISSSLVIREQAAKIAPRIVDGEPTCSHECPGWGDDGDCGEWIEDAYDVCVGCAPALRRQRDEFARRCEDADRMLDAARAEADRLRQAVEFQKTALVALAESDALAKEERDAARRLYCEVERDTEGEEWVRACAALQGWQYLYAPAPPATGTEEGGEG